MSGAYRTADKPKSQKSQRPRERYDWLTWASFFIVGVALVGIAGLILIGPWFLRWPGGPIFWSIYLVIGAFARLAWKLPEPFGKDEDES